MKSNIKVKLFTILFILLWLSLLVIKTIKAFVFKKINHYLNVFINFVYTYIKKR